VCHALIALATAWRTEVTLTDSVCVCGFVSLVAAGQETRFKVEMSG
jgi:hypothetical protein